MLRINSHQQKLERGKEGFYAEVQRERGFGLLAPELWGSRFLSFFLSHRAWRLMSLNLWKAKGGSVVGRAEGEGKLPCGTHKSEASLVGSCPIIQSQHVSCPREAATWGEVALSRGRPWRSWELEVSVGLVLSNEHPPLLGGPYGWQVPLSTAVNWGENVWLWGWQSFYLT